MPEPWQGSCHCGAIGYRYDCDLAPAEWPVRACQCHFCRSHDALSTSVRDGQIAFVAVEPQHLQRYRFGLRTADFLLCRNCGVYVGAVIETPQGRFGIINLRTLDLVPADLTEAASVHYDGEDAAGRISRREQRWAKVTEVP